ncbi:MAG: hypothetical protein ACRDU0_02815 [Mycobacterium sp.]
MLSRPLRFVEVAPPVARLAILDRGQSEVMAEAIMGLRATAVESYTSVVHPTVEDVNVAPATAYHEISYST